MKIKKTSAFLLALSLICFSAGCGKKGAEGTPPSPEPPSSQVFTPEFKIESSEIDGGSAILYSDGDYVFNCGFYGENGKRSDVTDAVSWSSSDESVLTVENGALRIKKAGNAVVGAKVTIGGNVYENSVSVSIIDFTRIRPSAVSAALFTGEKMDGAPDNNVKEKQLSAWRWNAEEKKAEKIGNGEIVWQSGNENVASVDENGLVKATGNGSTVVSGTASGQSFEVKIDVFTPVYTADDMDRLSMLTYTESAEEAARLLSYNYMLMNDIDYSAHTRQIILPIASMTAEDYKNMIGKCGSPAGSNSYFSYFWKNMLNLTESTDGDSVTRLYKDEAKTEKFAGINPNGIHFTGILDGNGYSIKGSEKTPAWLLVENMLLGNYFDVRDQYSAGAICFMGYNDGIVRDLAFENVIIGASETFCKTDENNQRYYEHNVNPMKYYITGAGSSLTEAQKEERLAAIRANNPMYIAYEAKNFENSQGRAVAFSEWQDWGSRLCGGSAFFLQNRGTIENVCLKYRNVGSLGQKVDMGGLVYLNESLVQNCYLELDLKESYSNGKKEEPGYCVAVTNFGSVSNVRVVTTRITNTDYAEIYGANGTSDGVNSFATVDNFLANSNATGKYDLTKWQFTTTVSLKKNNKGI